MMRLSTMNVLCSCGILFIIACLTSPIGGETPDQRRLRFESSLVPFEHFAGTPRENETATISTRMAKWRVTGCSVGVIRDFRVDWVKGYGKERPGGADVSDRSRFQVASMSKFVTAMATMQLMQNGTLDLDRNVNDYLTSWKVAENNMTTRQKVTLRRILSHTAGLTIHGFPGYRQGALVPDVVQVLNGTPPANTGPVYVDTVPGTLMRYSGGGTTIEQLLLSDTTGWRFEDVMQDQVFSRLGMSDSTFETRERRNLANVASGCLCHNDNSKEVFGHWNTYPEKAAAGLWTTPTDLAKFLINLGLGYHGNASGLLNASTTREMFTIPNATNSERMRYGLGPSVVRRPGNVTVFNHGGSNHGYCGHMVGTTDGRGWVLLTNGDCQDVNPYPSEVVRGILAAYGWHDLNNIFSFGRRLRVKPPLSSPQPYEGRYRVPPPLSEALNMTEVAVRADSLRLGREDTCSVSMYPCADQQNRFCTATSILGPITFHYSGGRVERLVVTTPIGDVTCIKIRDDVSTTPADISTTPAGKSTRGAPNVDALLLFLLVVYLWQSEK